MQARCDRGAEIARLLGFEAPTAEAIRALDEHWDGRGQPRGLRGEEIPLLGRILCLAQTTEIFHADGGLEAALGGRPPAQRRLVRPAPRRRASAPSAATRTSGRRSPRWTSRRGSPPTGSSMANEARLDAIADAFAGVIDAKSPWTYRHSDRACVITLGLAAALGADDDELSDLRRAALLHDVGKLAVSNRILDKPGKLTPAEFAKIREHPVMTRRILERVPGFGALAPVAAAHHERLDGSGYPQGLAGDELTMPMRLLAVADVYEALTSERPYRAAMRSEEAMAIIRVEAPHHLDQDAAMALGVARPRHGRTGRDRPAAARRGAHRRRARPPGGAERRATTRDRRRRHRVALPAQGLTAPRRYAGGGRSRTRPPPELSSPGLRPADGPGRRAALSEELGRDAVLLGLAGLGRIAAAAHELPRRAVELVLAAVLPVGGHRGRVAAGLALGDAGERRARRRRPSSRQTRTRCR